MPTDSHPAYYERNDRIQSTETTFFRACAYSVLTQWGKHLQLGPQLEIFEAGLLKLIVNSASNACKIHTLSTSLFIDYNLHMKIYITPSQQLKEIRKLNGTLVDVLQQS